jgi:hypothetical protein
LSHGYFPNKLESPPKFIGAWHVKFRITTQPPSGV